MTFRMTFFLGFGLTVLGSEFSYAGGERTYTAAIESILADDLVSKAEPRNEVVEIRMVSQVNQSRVYQITTARSGSTDQVECLRVTADLVGGGIPDENYRGEKATVKEVKKVECFGGGDR